MLLSYGWRWKKEEPCKKNHSLSYSFILQAQAQLPESLPAFSIATEKKGKKGVGGKIGIITHVCTYMRT